MKRVLKIGLLLGIIVLSTTGCFKRDNFEDIEIYTTAYPMTYITEYLYGEHSTIHSIYPKGINIKDFDLSKKQMNHYSNKGDLFIFNGISKEKDYVIPMITNNPDLKIIDTSLSMEYVNEVEELWLDPSNFLMLTQNIRDGLREYINNHYLKEEINEKYEELRVKVSEIDAKLKLLAESSNDKTIVVSSDLFKFLEKYNLTVISLEENNNLTDKTVEDVKNMIYQGKIDYIYMPEDGKVTNTIKEIQKETNVELLRIHSISNISEEDEAANKNYITLMNENIDLLKNELYD